MWGFSPFETLILITMLVPTVATVGNVLLRNAPDYRDTLTFAAACATFLAVLGVLCTYQDIEVPTGADISAESSPVFVGPWANYEAQRDGDTVRLTHPDGQETYLTQAQELIFADRIIETADIAILTQSDTFTLLTVMPGLDLAFNVEPLGLLFALVASGLWILTHIYAIGYMRGNSESHHARFFACFSFAIASVMGIAFSSNMFSLFVFYELLTLSTYPLVAHKGTPEAIRGARTYLGILIGTSIGLQLVAVVWTYAVVGHLDFTKGGILEGHIAGPAVAVLLALYAFGIGKAALMPFHRWLPAAMVAPTPVSALLHAVAVVKAGVFTMLKVGVYIFGIDFLAESGASNWLMWLAAFTIIAASIVAMTKDNLKARLAYSTVSQLSYITLGMALATSMGVIGGGMHIAMHAMGKITLFMCAGSIYVATHKTDISQMTGLGRIMPITFGAFLIGALSIIGLPPLGGSWGKWLLMVGAADTGQQIMIGVLMLSSLLNVAYLLPIVGRGFFLKSEENPPGPIAEAHLFVWLPPVITALGCLILFFYASDIQAFLMPITEAPL